MSFPEGNTVHGEGPRKYSDTKRNYGNINDILASSELFVPSRSASASSGEVWAVFEFFPILHQIFLIGDAKHCYLSAS